MRDGQVPSPKTYRSSSAPSHARVQGFRHSQATLDQLLGLVFDSALVLCTRPDQRSNAANITLLLTGLVLVSQSARGISSEDEI